MCRIRVKVCGLTRPSDARLAAELGVDAVGMVFYSGSPRCVSARQAMSICAALPPFVQRVALFVDAPSTTVQQVLRDVPALDVLQFHGAEDAAYCRQFNRPYIKALPLGGDERVDLDAQCAHYHDARALLLDGHRGGQMGGSGQSVNLSRLQPSLERVPLDRLILAGGLRPDNVVSAVQQSGIRAVDVSSGVESRPGIKSKPLLSAFMHSVREQGG